MSVLENFKNIPRSLYGGRQGSNVIFFLQICNEVPGEKKKRGGLSPPQRATGPCRPLGGRQGPVLAWPTKPIEFHKIPPASEDLL